MSQLSLDEYRLMMGTQIWLKSAAIDLLNTLLGGDSSKANSSNDLNAISKELESLSNGKSRVSKTKDNLKDSTNRLQELLEKEKKEKKRGPPKEPIDPSKVDLRDFSLLVNDNSQRRDGKVGSLTDKLRNYKSKGYL